MAARRFAVTVSYHGAGFAGSQRQAKDRTVQQELETAAERLFGVATAVAMAGRTDSGVHATGQVAAFSAETLLDARTVERALNAHLPFDVAVREAREVQLDFSPRYGARKRSYRYTILQGETRDPLLRDRTWHVREPLDAGLMNEAGQALLGTHDFSACSGPLEPGRNPVRTITLANWQRDGRLLTFDIEAEAFLPQMVRRITGGLARTGRGAQTPETFARLLAEAKPGSIGPTAPPHGLCLQRVWYEEGYLA